MKLPIYLHIEEDTIWITYKSELAKLQNASELKTFVKRWENLFTNVKEDSLTEDILAKVKADKVDGPGHEANLIAELIIPVKVVKAMLVAEKYIVPLNTAFIQMNGGLGEFEDAG
jgi:hypothetical protein